MVDNKNKSQKTEKGKENEVKNKCGHLEKTKKWFKIIILLTYTSAITFFFTVAYYESFKVPDNHILHYRILNEVPKTGEALSYKNDVRKVLNFIGHREIKDGLFNLLWTHNYPYVSMEKELRELLPYQKVNHIPGAYILTLNILLYKFHMSPYLPKGFKLPEDEKELQNFAVENPNISFVEQNNGKYAIKKFEDIKNFQDNIFYYEHTSNPLLIGNRLFDIGIFVVVTSIDPLRVYVYEGDIQVRFSQELYHPFDPDNHYKFILRDMYKTIWDVEETKKYQEYAAGGMKNAFNAYMRSQGHNTNEMWLKVYDAAASTLLNNADKILYLVNQEKFHQQTVNSFEILRFDMILTDKLHPIITDIVMSPRFYDEETQQEHFKFHYQHFLYSTLNLVGLGANPLFEQNGATNILQYMVHDKDIVVDLNMCVNCLRSANKPECILCPHQKTLELETMDRAFASFEHFNKGNMKRIFPSIQHYSYNLISKLSKRNQAMTLWFMEKCKDNAVWC